MPRTPTWKAGAVLIALSAALASCRDTPTEQVGGGGKVVEQLVGCRVEVATGNTVCDPLARDGKPLGQASGNLIPDAQWMVETVAGAYTSTDSTYRFSLRVTNDTEATLGTQDGVNATGLKVFLPYRVMGYPRQPGNTTDPYGILIPPLSNTNNTVHARNPDGIGSFTGESQPYWHYPEMLQPWESTDWREWQFTVNPGVAYFYFAVSIFAHAAGEQAMGPQAPLDWTIPADSVDRIFADANLIYAHPRMSGPYPRDLVLVFFKPDATEDAKQAAVDHVGGTVVGGDGAHYYVKVASGSAPVFTAIDKLALLPQVQHAIPYLLGLAPTYLRPTNGTGWERKDWEVHPDSARGDNWAAEAIAAPAAWGCETGVSAIRAAVIDVEEWHGRSVGSILRSPGNTNANNAGISWGTTLTVKDASRGGTVTTNPGIKANLIADFREVIKTQQVHVVNISLSVSYSDSATKLPRLPIPGKPADIAKAQAFATEWRTVLTQIEAETTNRPLYVIAAGNYEVDLLYSGFPELARTGALAPRAIAVAGHTSTRIGKNRTMWINSGIPLAPGSNTGAHIAAPGSPVHVRSGVAADDGMYSGTSFAAPHVAGIAALLYSQLPTRDAAKVREYLMAGATRGGRMAGSHPIANAYESLKRGAEDTGAPLCGNRVWGDGAQIRAQRGAGSEAIGPAETGGAQIGDIITQHGGRVILYNSSANQGKALHRQPDGSWTLGAIPTDFNPNIGGATWSVRAYSHFPSDSLVGLATGTVNNNVWWRTGSQTNVPVILRSLQNGAVVDVVLTNLTVTDLPDPEYNICVERFSGGSCAFTQLSGRSWMFRVAFPQAYQPILISVTPMSTVFTDSTPWIACPKDASRTCRRARSDVRWATTKVFSVPLKGGAATLVDTIPKTVFWMGQTEAPGSDSLAMGRGLWVTESWFDGNSRTQETTTNELSSCAIEYRSLATLKDVAHTINSDMACGWTSFTSAANHGQGSFAPTRAPAPPGGSAGRAPGSVSVDIEAILRAQGTRRR